MHTRRFVTVTDKRIISLSHLVLSRRYAYQPFENISSNAFYCGNLLYCSKRHYNIICMRLYYIMYNVYVI